jgi:hypothetical protein
VNKMFLKQRLLDTVQQPQQLLKNILEINILII